MTFPTEARRAPRRRWRLPPLAVPAVGYWLAMGALTYGFTQLGPNPLDEAVAPPAAAAALPAPAAEPQTAVEMAPAAAAPAAEPSVPVAGTEPPVDVESPAAAARDREVERTDTEPGERRADARTSEAKSERVEQAPPIRTAEPAPVAFSFPEFTDSSRPARPERAADGPRIDSLFERAEDRPSEHAPEPNAPPATDRDAPVAVTSCEAAIARNNEQLTIGGARGPADITREAYASILQNGRYLSGCSIPDRTVFEICAAVKDGRAIGITVVSSPSSSALNACVRNAVGRLKFPQNARLDVTHTRFDAVKR
ncbi:MAG TPA: hypothetical protein VHP33_04675 [Polyangiaceae bacterium]|nr:hypothetical protein [Polyangiaceae bacterium]